MRGRERASAPTSSDSTSSAPAPILPAERTLLALLSRLAAPTLSASTFTPTLQAVKAALYAKDYAAAFGDEAYREAYAARWVPSRALIYRRVFQECGGGRVIKRALLGGAAGAEATTTKAIMLGGGAGSEVLGLAAFLGELEGDEWAAGRKVEIVAVDNADWTSVLARQETALLEGYPSLATSSRLSISFHNADVLTDSTLPYSSASLITLLFTISELFLQSRAQTLALLSSITTSAKRGTLLLIVESASLAMIPIGKEGNAYPLGMLLDNALAQDKGREPEQRAKWEVIEEEEKKWYRMPTGAADCYPLQLENSRVVLRLYRRV